MAKKAAVSQQLISQLENNRNATTKELPQIARALGVPVAAIDPTYAELASEIAPLVGDLVPVRTMGTVEAGAFRAVDEFEEEETVTLWEPRDHLFPMARQLSWTVSGDSMNNLRPRPIMPGDRVIGVAFDDLQGRVLLRDGMVLVVERSLAGGHVREWSVKQLELYDDRLEFHPRSTNPRHKPIVVKKDLRADDGQLVSILAVVRRVTNDVPL